MSRPEQNMSKRLRKEEKPELVNEKGHGKADLPMDDPNYHYRIVSKEHEVSDRVEHHKGIGYGVAKHGSRHIVMACKREEHEQRQQEAMRRADRMRSPSLPSGDGLIADDTSIEVTRGLRTADE
jgi:hypothetical protein